MFMHVPPAVVAWLPEHSTPTLAGLSRRMMKRPVAAMAPGENHGFVIVHTTIVELAALKRVLLDDGQDIEWTRDEFEFAARCGDSPELGKQVLVALLDRGGVPIEGMRRKAELANGLAQVLISWRLVRNWQAGIDPTLDLNLQELPEVERVALKCAAGSAPRDSVQFMRILSDWLAAIDDPFSTATDFKE